MNREQETYKAWMKKKHIGSSLDDFLKKESIFERSSVLAVKRVIAWQIEQEMTKQKFTNTAMTKKNAKQPKSPRLKQSF